MKKILVLILSLVLCIFSSYGQIYNSIKYLDKFDDEVKLEKLKTIVTKTDTTFIIETKGRNPEIYYIINYADYNSAGDKDNIVNLVNNVYGYQESYCVIKEEDKQNYLNAVIYNLGLVGAEIEKYGDKITPEIREKIELSFKDKLIEDLSKYWLFTVHRVITTQYSHSYQTEIFWIQDEDNNKLGKNINRIIYNK